MWQGVNFTYFVYKNIDPEKLKKHISYIYPTISNIKPYNI